MRLILEAFQNLAAPTRRTRRLLRRPYFPDARMFFEMTAPNYSIDPTRTIRFLADPDSFGLSPVAIAPPAGGPRRRRRRRRRRPRRGGITHTAAPSGDINGAGASTPSPDPERRD